MMHNPRFHPIDPSQIPEELRCAKSPLGMHAYLESPYACHHCGEENVEMKQRWQAIRDQRVAVGARENYHNTVQAVALQLLSQFMQANMIRDMGAVIRESGAVKAPLGLTEMLDMSLAGAIHFVNELAKLSPGKPYVDFYAQRFDAKVFHEPGIYGIPPQVG